MNLGQLIDPEWAQAGFPARFPLAVRPELVEAQQQAERERKAEAHAEARRAEEHRLQMAKVAADRKAEVAAAGKQRRIAAMEVARTTKARRVTSAPKPEHELVPEPKGQRPAVQLAILGALMRSTIRLGVSDIARSAKLGVAQCASNIGLMHDLHLIDRTGARCSYRYAATKAGREKFARYGLYT